MELKRIVSVTSCYWVSLYNVVSSQIRVLSSLHKPHEYREPLDELLQSEMEKQIITFNFEIQNKTKEERAAETYKTLAGVIRKLTIKLKALRVFIEKLSNGAPNYEFKLRIQELLQTILSS